jgi:hypothetical protein
VKLRIHKNSLRFRLSRVDVERMRTTGMCADALCFGGMSQLSYVLEASSQCGSIQAEFFENRIRVRIPEQLAKEWADSDRVSLGQSGTNSGSPDILIERDFQCLNRDGRGLSEDEESFPNPSAVAHCG